MVRIYKAKAGIPQQPAPAAEATYKESIGVKEFEVENRGIEEGFFKYLCHEFHERSPFWHTYNLQYIYIGKGSCAIKMYMEPEYSTPGDRVHGGTIAMLADTAMGDAVISATGRIYRTMDINVTYLAPVLAGSELTAEGYVIHAGRTIAVAEAKLFNKENTLVAKTNGTFIVDNKMPPL